MDRAEASGQEGTSTKDRLLRNAVSMFSEKGFHGTSMREIAKASGCGLPTLYYHYSSKSELFEEIVVNQFLKITEKMNKQVDFTKKPEEIYLQVIRTRINLEGFDRDVYKMALKVWLGFEDSGKAREKVLEWENKRAESNRRIMARGIANEALREDVMEILINYIENMVNRIILLDENVDEDKVRRQISLLFAMGL
ncbi:MAG TPA: TetR/AcrR family transcriptional regulator [Bacillota bacterium]|nr:TetR/AcrR family transcriptional regulator [Bacillota bacterium]HOH10520.1 TetR/AcrR family transcriptional regulator [Bacillota bacterium]HOS49888.1 TetR/AcrR family transcriptional regulator [Bacillota bacterium]HOY88445.1 TetR/AcrR family transcriptional regulator [Bacillota bacterium]HPI01567.1 TetR/AcrR family transcriptional regulator [Bacillota bacterium]